MPLLPGALELLKERRANWADEVGSAHIDGPGVFGRPPKGGRATAEALLAKDWSRAGRSSTALNADRAIEEAGLSSVAEGGRVAFFPAHPSVLAMSQATPVGPIVSNPRIYADLLAIGGRAEDAAAGSTAWSAIDPKIPAPTHTACGRPVTVSPEESG